MTLKDEIIRKYVRDFDGLLEEMKLFQAQTAWKVLENAVIFLFGRIFRYLSFEDIILGHEKKGSLDGWAWNEKAKKPTVIEFEARSRNFLKDKHDLTKCDLIVCWEDNWEECPVDVLELKYFWEKANEDLTQTRPT